MLKLIRVHALLATGASSALMGAIIANLRFEMH